MLSYRHAFHAGNHADVLKHFVLVRCFEALARKDKACWYIDTHAGAGVYPLDRGYATQNAEHEGGIVRLWRRSDLPEVLRGYMDLVRACNGGTRLHRYPGSPWIARAMMRPDDRLRLFELHRSDAQQLAKTFDGAGKRILVGAEDGFQGLKGLLPPPTRRALVLIDPSYEVKSDYEQVVDCLRDSLARFATGIYAIWHPLLQSGPARRLPEELKAAGAPSWLHVTLTVRTPAVDGFGMHGSGMFVVNPPWTLPADLEAGLPYLVRLLGEDPGACFALDRYMP